MDVIRDCIESGANKNIEKQREELRSLPVYTFSATFAKEHGELETYRTSHRANVACKTPLKKPFPAIIEITGLTVPVWMRSLTVSVWSV